MTDTAETKTPYRVLALKYRPKNFSELIGQEALVRTLTNAIETGRLANAYMLTGVRGVGKTTTARIIAKALNYKGPDGTSGPTTGPTDDCSLCRAITEDRHPDVMEMDAASRTGVDDIREILDGVRYAPTEARYKVYIIDEVHMLSKQAFNALLKTLEEPPPHVKFIFATTEIRKVPVTVLSRCQRFDLRRVDIQTLQDHFKNICGQENVGTEDEALSIIARAADGSVRDGLSILDQAIALSDDKVTAAGVKDMLGLADRARNIDLLEFVLQGNVAEALSIMDDLYKAGADPAVIIQDLLDITHVLTRQRAAPNAGDQAGTMTTDQLARCSELASKLSMPTLGKAWQILLKGLGEVHQAPNQQNAAEMVLIRLCYAADLPDPADLLKKLKDGSITVSASTAATAPAGTPEGAPVAMRAVAGGGMQPATIANPATAPAISPQIDEEPASETAFLYQDLETLEDMIEMLESQDEFLLASQIYQFAHLVKLENGADICRLEIRPEEEAPNNFIQNLSTTLKQLTGKRWVVSVSSKPGAPTLVEKTKERIAAELDEIKRAPLIKEILKYFPEAEIINIKKSN